LSSFALCSFVIITVLFIAIGKKIIYLVYVNKIMHIDLNVHKILHIDI